MRHLSLVLCYPVLIFLRHKPQYKPNCCLRLDLMTFRLIDCPSFLSSYPPVWNEIPKAILQGDICLPNELKLTVETKCFTIDVFPLLTECFSVVWNDNSCHVSDVSYSRQRSARCSRKKTFLFGSEIHSCLLSLLFIDLSWCGGVSELKLEKCDFTWQNKMLSVSQSSSWLWSPH